MSEFLQTATGAARRGELVGCRTQLSASRDSVAGMSGRGGGFGNLGRSTGSTGAAAPRRGGGGGGWRGFGTAGPVDKVPKERQGPTLRRMIGFFLPYKAKIAEKELFLQGKIKEAGLSGTFEELEKLEKQLANDLRHLQEDCEEKKAKLRASFGK